LGSLVNIVPKCHIGAVSSSSKWRFRGNGGKMGEDTRIDEVRWDDYQSGTQCMGKSKGLRRIGVLG
jgi:hypothetical protein